MKNINKFLVDVVSLGFCDTKNISFSHLDVVSLNKELKQTIRLLQIFKKISKPLNLHIWVENQLLVLLLTKIFSFKNSRLNISISTSAPTARLGCSSLLLILGVPYLKFNNTLVKKFFESKNFLVVKINSAAETNCFSTYKVLSSLKDIKKFVFLSILIKKTFDHA
jgi:hypothetical protein